MTLLSLTPVERKRLNLIKLLSPNGHCAICNEHIGYEALEVTGTSWDNKKLTPGHRYTRYWQAYKSGVQLNALCSPCKATTEREQQLAYWRDYNARHKEKRRAYSKQWYQDNKEHVKETTRRYLSKNAEKVRESAANRYRANKEHLSETRKAHYENNKEKTLKRQQDRRAALFLESPKEAWLYYTAQGARHRAKKKGLAYDKDLSGLFLPDVCPVLGIPLKYSDRRGSPSADSPSLDRIVPEYGYVRSNLRVISHRANMLKSNASIDELRHVLADIEACLSRKNGV